MKLVIKDLTKTYPNGVKALNNLSLEVEQGMFGLLGPNGAGKSTLMRTLATLQEADAGEVWLDDLNVLKEKEKVKRILGYLPQTFGTYTGVSAQELLMHFAVIKGVDGKKRRKELVETLLQKVNLYADRKKKVQSFSGGMLQRMGIAIALLGDPRMIIVDEPTAGLDPAERVRFNNLLSEISEDKIVILSTHIVDDVSDLCSQAAIINKGEVWISGRPQEMLAALEGRIWEKSVSKEEFLHYEANFHLVYSRLQEGRPLIHVFDEQKPDGTFRMVSPTLEDLYFTTLKEA